MLAKKAVFALVMSLAIAGTGMLVAGTVWAGSWSCQASVSCK